MTFSVVFYISGPFESKWKKIYSEVKKKHLGVRENVPGNFSKQRFRQQWLSQKIPLLDKGSSHFTPVPLAIPAQPPN